MRWQCNRREAVFGGGYLCVMLLHWPTLGKGKKIDARLPRHYLPINTKKEAWINLGRYLLQVGRATR
jgi:hypothetical protein